MNFSANRQWLIILFLFIIGNLYAQPLPGGRDDSEVARQYVLWIQQAIDEGRMREAAAALVRANDFAAVSSDILYLTAVTRSYYMFENETRLTVLQALNTAIEINRWVNYSENDALLFKAGQQLAIRDYSGVLETIDRLPWRGEAAGSAQVRADGTMLHLLALRGMALSTEPDYNHAQALTQFRSSVVSAMDRFSRDPRPLRIFFEYARYISPQSSEGDFAGSLLSGDINLLELVLRRLPFLLETDPELAWMAASLMRDEGAARRLIASYRSGGISHIQNRDFMPHHASIPVALNLGLIDDFKAIEELFSGSRGINYPHPPQIIPDGNPVLEKEIIIDTYRLLRSEEGRNLFTQKLITFSGTITSDDDHDGFIDYLSVYNSGVLKTLTLDLNQDNAHDFQIVFDINGTPVSGINPVAGYKEPAHIQWERYPSVLSLNWNNLEFKFRPADFQFAPVIFIELGGSSSLSGLLLPEPAFQYINLTYRTIFSMSSSVTRQSPEIDGAMETIYLEQTIPLQAIEVLNGRQVSVTEFERGQPVIQHIDLDLDGRMETIRRFRSPRGEISPLDYRSLTASSESDWSGDGRSKTREVYLPDGSIVYYFDMDGSGQWTYQETRIPR